MSERKETDSERLVSVETLATLTEMSRSFWQKKLQRRELRSFRLGRAVRVRLDDALAFLAAGERSANRVRR